MGQVYLAEDTKLARRVAIKFLSSDLIADERANRRLIKEARSAAKLDHPNICAIYEIGDEQGQNFIVMQYLEGETLEHRLKTQKLTFKQALNIAIETAQALKEAHLQGIIHRDIKPANIMITTRGQVKVMDFGLAKLVSSAQENLNEAKTQTFLSIPGTVIGTLPYMSPEQVRGEQLDARSDIFSFGILLYEMLSGTHPFSQKSAAATAAAVLTHQPPPLAKSNSECSQLLQDVINRCLEKDREQRYATIDDLEKDLIQARQEISSPPAAPLPSQPTEKGRRTRKSWADGVLEPRSSSPLSPRSRPSLTSWLAIVFSAVHNHE